MLAGRLFNDDPHRAGCNVSNSDNIAKRNKLLALEMRDEFLQGWLETQGDCRCVLAMWF